MVAGRVEALLSVGWQPIPPPDMNVLMSQALRRPLLTVDEFHDWEPPPGQEDYRWELVDGEPECMAPPGVNHGAIQNQVGMLLGLHLRTHRPSCRVVITAGVIPHLRARFNERVPDLGVSCAPFTDSRSLVDPVLLVEILSPSNEAKTRANAWAYATIPSVQDVLNPLKHRHPGRGSASRRRHPGDCGRERDAAPAQHRLRRLPCRLLRHDRSDLDLALQ
jgi:Uma2 family endonuclease